MKIYSWNMLFRNTELERAFAFIRDSAWDIFCLQEVPEEFLARLRELPCEITDAPESDRDARGGRATIYSVILSRYPIRVSTRIPLPFHDPFLPIRGKLFANLMFLLRLWVRGRGNRHALYADIATPQGLVRVFNLHLILLSPRVRLQEFETAMLQRDTTLPSIVCGDFNTIEAPRLSILNWVLGGSLVDTLLYTRERTHLESRFAAHELTNVLRGTITHPLSQSQLDHILVSKHFSLQTATVMQDLLGSDHYPLQVNTEVTL